tara:strand:+ start:40 stop:966 length:927 start_codon:yes stop_codon:yes gene_type:complete
MKNIHKKSQKKRKNTRKYKKVTRIKNRKIEKKTYRKKGNKVKRTKNKRNNTRKSTRKTKKIEIMNSSKKIIDIPFSSKKNLGTLASEGIIGYNYQHTNNPIRFLSILSKRKEIKNISFLFQGMEIGMLWVNIINQIVNPFYITNTKFIRELKKKHKRFIPIMIQSELPKDYSMNNDFENHANVLLVDQKKKVIEFFEPHGYKKDYSTPSEHVTKYHTKYRLLKEYFSKIFPKYKFINASDITEQRGFQYKYDSNSGYCVTWSCLFVHYRLLNPDEPLILLMKHIDKKIRVTQLLKYARYIEEVLKYKV